MKIDVLNQEGKVVGQTLLPKEVFSVPMNSDLLNQVVNSQIANRRQMTADTKDRSEVRGGGRKPWRQKGTGRARHGSIRSPLWKGGGVTFGPTTKRVFYKKIPKKIKRKALFIVLSAKTRDNLILVLEDLKIEKIKTKTMAEIFKKLFLDKGSSLIVLAEKDDKVIKSARNIAKTKIMMAKDLNALALLSYKYLVMPKEAIKVIRETFNG